MNRSFLANLIVVGFGISAGFFLVIMSLPYFFRLLGELSWHLQRNFYVQMFLLSIFGGYSFAYLLLKQREESREVSTAF